MAVILGGGTALLLPAYERFQDDQKLSQSCANLRDLAAARLAASDC